MNADQVSNSSVVKAATAHPVTRLVPDRECGTCTLCCKVVGVLEIAKPAGVWCPHCKGGGKRCTIYDTRFASCRAFYCQWMIEKSLGPEWKPEHAKFVLVKSDDGHRLSACVDPGYPSAWRRSPYYENLKLWAAEGIRRSPDIHLVDVMIGSRCIVILPGRDVDLGILAPDEGISLESKMNGVVEACKVKHQLSPVPPAAPENTPGGDKRNTPTEPS